MNSTSGSLLERLRQPGQPRDWERFVELYAPFLLSWARRLGAAPQDAEDLVQDVLTLLVQKLPEFVYNPARSFRAWLRTVVLNRWRDRLRRAGPRVGLNDAELSDLTERDGAEALWEE